MTAASAATAATAAVLTVSDGVTHGTRADESGDVATALLREAGFDVAVREVVPDERPRIEEALRRLAAAHALVVTTGGTGFGPRDVTPEATKAVLDREAPGLAELMRREGLASTPMAALSRATVGTDRIGAGGESAGLAGGRSGITRRDPSGGAARGRSAGRRHRRPSDGTRGTGGRASRADAGGGRAGRGQSDQGGRRGAAVPGRDGHDDRARRRRARHARLRRVRPAGDRGRSRTGRLRDPRDARAPSRPRRHRGVSRAAPCPAPRDRGVRDRRVPCRAPASRDAGLRVGHRRAARRARASRGSPGGGFDRRPDRHRSRRDRPDRPRRALRDRRARRRRRVAGAVRRDDELTAPRGRTSRRAARARASPTATSRGFGPPSASTSAGKDAEGIALSIAAGIVADANDRDGGWLDR